MAGLTYKEFSDACLELLDLSKKIGDNWKANGNIDTDGNFFLSKRQCVDYSPRIHKALKSVSNDVCDLPVTHEDVESSDPSSLGAVMHSDMITYEYHVVYSLSHSVPTLYFNASTVSGRSLQLEEIWEKVPPLFNDQVMQKKWESLTQQEHPVLGIPFFQLHPCHTMTLMSKLKYECSNISDIKGWRYILSWLSMFGPVVGLEISPQYFTS